MQTPSKQCMNQKEIPKILKITMQNTLTRKNHTVNTSTGKQCDGNTKTVNPGSTSCFINPVEWKTLPVMIQDHAPQPRRMEDTVSLDPTLYMHHNPVERKTLSVVVSSIMHPNPVGWKMLSALIQHRAPQPRSVEDAVSSDPTACTPTP